MRKKVQEKKQPAVAEKIETVDSASRVVLVLRHAKAQPKSGKPDFNRRLTKQGREDAAQVGKKIARGIRPRRFCFNQRRPARARHRDRRRRRRRNPPRQNPLLQTALRRRRRQMGRAHAPPARRRQNGFARRPQPRMRRPHRAARRGQGRDEKIRPRRFALRRSLERNRPRLVPLAQSFPRRQADPQKQCAAAKTANCRGFLLTTACCKRPTIRACRRSIGFCFWASFPPISTNFSASASALWSIFCAAPKAESTTKKRAKSSPPSSNAPAACNAGSSTRSPTFAACSRSATESNWSRSTNSPPKSAPIAARIAIRACAPA